MDFTTILITTLGIILLIFIPGVSLTLALFPRRKDLDIIERVALSFVLGLMPQFLLYFFEKNFFVPVTFETTSLTILSVSAIGFVIWFVRKKR
jgi:uncharacterized membrane protein